MKKEKFLKDKFYFIISFFIVYLLLLFTFLAFKVKLSFIIFTTILLLFFFISTLVIEYLRKNKFYRELLTHIELLDQSYLVLETIDKPNFYEGELLYQSLYEINKSMNENVNNLMLQMNDFKEYIEMWIHEVKIPISSLILMAHNHKEKYDKKLVDQMKRIEDYVEQVLYYVRSENAEKDYLINEVSLSKIISKVALRNKDDLLENKIDFKVRNVSFKILTDSKWLEFILNQIVNNSIKYKKNNRSYIQIEAKEEKNKIILMIEDNGMGIPLSDIPKVFDKSFTGHNGRGKAKSTGMGLFICKNLCQKLGHKIEIESQEKSYTRIYITFYQNSFYDVVK